MSKTGPKEWSLRAGVELVELDDGRICIAHPEGSAVVRIDRDVLVGVLDAARADGVDAALTSFGLSNDEAWRSLLQSLGERPAPARALAAITVVGNGEWSRSVAAALNGATLGDVDHVALSAADQGRWRYPPTSVATLASDPRWAKGSGALVIAVEATTLSSVAALIAAAIGTGRPTITATLDAGVVRVGPALYDGAPPCALCHRLHALGLDPRDRMTVEALAALSISGSASDVVLDAARTAIVAELGALLRTGVPYAPGTVLTISEHGRERVPVPPVLGCPACGAVSRRGSGDVAPPPSVPTPERAIALAIDELRRRGADVMGHAVGTFLEHLEGTARVLTAWGEPSDVCLAGLCHSVYGSDVFEKVLVLAEERETLARLIGSSAESLVWLFAHADRRRLWSQDHALVNWSDGRELVVEAEQRRALSVIDLANAVEQVAEPDLSPGIWVTEIVGRARQVRGRCALKALEVTEPREVEARALYVGACGDLVAEPERALRDLTRAAELNPVVGEPLIVASELLERLDRDGAFELAERGVARLRRLGASWDKRSGFDDWVRRGLTVGWRASDKVESPRP